MICSLRFKKKMFLSYKCCFALDFVFLVLKLYPIQVIISLPLWIKLTMGQLLLLFLRNFCSFFVYVGGVLVTNFFSLLFSLFHLQRSSELPQKHWHHSRDRNLLKHPQSHFHYAKAPIFCCFDVFTVQPPQIFQGQAKISTIRLVYLSVFFHSL